MKVEQHVMAYEAEQDRLRALLPGGFVSLRPVLRINAEIRDDLTGYVELNTPVEHEGAGAGSMWATGRMCPLPVRGRL